jgi:hypothetical protein
MRLGFVATVALHEPGFACRTPGTPSQRRNTVDHGRELGDVVEQLSQVCLNSRQPTVPYTLVTSAKG